MAANQVLDRIRGEIIDSGRDSRYRIGGYGFLLNGMEFYLATIGEKRHVTGQELSTGLLIFAKKQFGPLAQSVLRYWGITTTGDLGNIVYNMIDIGILSKQPDDSIEHFFDVEDFNEFFLKEEYFKITPEFIKRIKGA